MGNGGLTGEEFGAELLKALDDARFVTADRQRIGAAFVLDNLEALAPDVRDELRQWADVILPPEQRSRARDGALPEGTGCAMRRAARRAIREARDEGGTWVQAADKAHQAMLAAAADAVVDAEVSRTRKDGDHPGCCEDGDRLIVWDGGFYDHRGGGTKNGSGWAITQAELDDSIDIDIAMWRASFCPFCGERLPE